MPLYASDGSLNVTVVDGNTRVTRQAADGSINVVDVTAVASPVGVHHDCGALNVTLVANHDTHVGRYAANGSQNVILTAGNSGAQHITVVAGAFV